MTDVINKRSYPIRKLDLAFDLILNGEIVPAVMTDYSLSGMAILIKGRSDLNAQVLDLKIRDLNLNATGKIIWTREMFAGLKAGVVKDGDALKQSGRLRRYTLKIAKWSFPRLTTSRNNSAPCFLHQEDSVPTVSGHSDTRRRNRKEPGNSACGNALPRAQDSRVSGSARPAAECLFFRDQTCLSCHGKGIPSGQISSSHRGRGVERIAQCYFCLYQ